MFRVGTRGLHRHFAFAGVIRGLKVIPRGDTRSPSAFCIRRGYQGFKGSRVGMGVTCPLVCSPSNNRNQPLEPACPQAASSQPRTTLVYPQPVSWWLSFDDGRSRFDGDSAWGHAGSIVVCSQLAFQPRHFDGSLRRPRNLPHCRCTGSSILHSEVAFQPRHFDG